MSKRFTVVSLFILLILVGKLANSKDVFSENEHCVAWKTKKRMVLFKTLYPVGKNCAIKTSFTKTESNKYQFVGEFPIAEFKSGEDDRDKEVFNILLGKISSSIFFYSEELSILEWKKILEENSGIISGDLKIGNEKFSLLPKIAIKINKKINNVEGLNQMNFVGQWKTDFSSFKIKPPTVAGGLVAKVYDELELHFSFRAKKIVGLEVLNTEEVSE